MPSSSEAVHEEVLKFLLDGALAAMETEARISAIGFANSYFKIGMMDEDRIQTVASNSGGSWFLTQFAFSQSFYDGVTKGNLDETVSSWMVLASISLPIAKRSKVRKPWR